MEVFGSESECIRFARKAVSKFEHLNEIVIEEDFEKWKSHLINQANFENYLVGADAKLNLLNTLVIVGLSIEKDITNPIHDHANILLSKLNTYLKTFSELKVDSNFLTKIKNLGGLNFLSTLSELSLANWFKTLQFQIQFETPFHKSETEAERDIDISITDSEGNILHFEVYMPNKQIDLEGPFSPDEQDHILLRKVQKKLYNKFGAHEIYGLTGKVFLAINKVFFDLAHIKTVIPFFSNDELYANMLDSLPTHIDGIFVFEDAFQIQCH